MAQASSRGKPWIIGITGASGAVYAVKLIQELLAGGIDVHLVVTDAGWRVLHDELGWKTSRRKEELERHFASYEGRYQLFPTQDIGASIASGSFLTEGMVIIPCSMGTLAAIAHGMSDNLLERAADVILKEKRKLIVVPRETPLNSIHLQNMLTLSQLGVHLIPAMPAFYHLPESLDQLISFMVGKVLDAMGIDHDLYKRWGDKHERSELEDSHREN